MDERPLFSQVANTTRLSSRNNQGRYYLSDTYSPIAVQQVRASNSPDNDDVEDFHSDELSYNTQSNLPYPTASAAYSAYQSTASPSYSADQPTVSGSDSYYDYDESGSETEPETSQPSYVMSKASPTGSSLPASKSFGHRGLHTAQYSVSLAPARQQTGQPPVSASYGQAQPDQTSSLSPAPSSQSSYVMSVASPTGSSLPASKSFRQRHLHTAQ